MKPTVTLLTVLLLSPFAALECAAAQLTVGGGSLGLMTASTAKFSVGMSNGGGFAPKPAYFLGFNACAIGCASGAPAALFNVTTVPTIWNLARNDDLYDHTNFLPNATANRASLAPGGASQTTLFYGIKA